MPVCASWRPGAGEATHAYRHIGTEVIAHRGGAGLWPENTLFAFQQATALGVDALETDVRATSDGVLVLLHDETVGPHDGRQRPGRWLHAGRAETA